MRRWQFCFALSLLASALYVPAADAAVSGEDEAGAIVSGLLADAADNPVAGAVDLFAWPTGRPVEVGQTLQLLPVGHDRAARDGLFAITGDLTPDLAELARLNGGYINFVLQTAAAGVIEETHFSRYVGDTPITAQEAGVKHRPVEWRASPEEPAEAVTIRVQNAPDATTPSDDRPISPMQGGCWGLRLIETQVANTVIGEVRAPHDTLEAVFVYGERADSEIGISGRGEHGPWSMSGSFHIANSEDTEVKQWAGSGEHRLVTSRFMYDKYEHRCPSGRREKVVPREWMGDVQSEPTAIRGCAGAPERRLGRYGDNTAFNRDRERAVRWDGAVSVFGASLTARSGYSRWVHGHWRFGSAPLHLLCGDNGPPKMAGHIFAGTSA
jgi:hypothetical protein